MTSMLEKVAGAIPPFVSRNLLRGRKVKAVGQGDHSRPAHVARSTGESHVRRVLGAKKGTLGALAFKMDLPFLSSTKNLKVKNMGKVRITGRSISTLFGEDGIKRSIAHLKGTTKPRKSTVPTGSIPYSGSTKVPGVPKVPVVPGVSKATKAPSFFKNMGSWVKGHPKTSIGIGAGVAGAGALTAAIMNRKRKWQEESN